MLFLTFFLAFVPQGTTIRTRLGRHTSANFLKDLGLNNIKSDGNLANRFFSSSLFSETISKAVSDLAIKGAHRIGTIYFGNNTFSNSGNSTVPFISKESSFNTIFVNDQDPSVIYKTELHFGRPTSKTLWRKKDINSNLIKRTLTNTERDYLSVIKKPFLTSDIGFNQRRFDFLGSDTYMTIKNYFDMLTHGKFNFETDRHKVTYYADVFNEEYLLSIRSLTDYYNVTIKIHFCKLNNPLLNVVDLIKGSFYSEFNLEDKGAYRVPKKKQLKPIQSFSKFKHSVITTKDCVFSQSDYMKENCTIVKTFSKILRPDDIWNFSYTHHHGPGMVINKLFNHPIKDVKQTHPTGLFVIVQIDGDPRGSITRNEDNTIFSGSSSAKISYKFERKLTYLADDEENLTYRKFQSNEDDFTNEILQSKYEADREDFMNVNYEDLEVQRAQIKESKKLYNVNYGVGRLPLMYKNDFDFSEIAYNAVTDFTDNKNVDFSDIDESSNSPKPKLRRFGGLDEKNKSESIDIDDPEEYSL